MVPVAVSILLFLATAPIARTPLAEVPAFIPIYVASLVICDLITAALLFGQYSVLRSPALLVLAGGYLYTTCITAAYAMVFPGLFSPTGLLGSGPQTTSAIYMAWHGGFPLFVMVYAGVKDSRLATTPGIAPVKASVPILSMITGVFAFVIASTLVATQGHAWLPVFLDGNRTTDVGRIFLTGVWVLSLVAALVLWRRKPHSVLDIWVLVVMCVWLCNIALAAMLNTGRYDLGWYVGRIYGLLAASSLLIALLIEDGRQYNRLVQMSVELRSANHALDRLSRHDGLTGLANRRYFDEYLAEQIAIASRHQRPLALLMCDVDHYKAYNDLYGHQAGDECLKQIARALRSCCNRPADMAARYGGEEFALILPDTGPDGAHQIAEAARQAVVDLAIPHERSAASAHVSISAGLALLNLKMDPDELLYAADQCLYQAKGQGRNRVVSMPMAA
ncbi:hypothetical protein GCM10027399_05140 [Curvibacter fontanus]|jgi:diguanylate cyclase (GGDEF)-like protein